jgi:hypothetical protein
VGSCRAAEEDCVNDPSPLESNTHGASRLTDGHPSHEARADLHRRVLPALTDRGYAKVRMPERLFRILERWYEQRADRTAPEEGVERIVRSTSTNAPSELLRLDSDSRLARLVLRRMQPLLEAWSGESLVPEALYGIRVYRRGAVLHRHVDHVESHVVSAVLLIAQDVDRPWPLVVEAADGSRRELPLEAGDALLYEGARLPHFRDVPLEGRAYAAVFIHYRPVWWRYRPEQVDVLARRQPLRALEYGDARAVSPPEGRQARGYLAFQADYGGWNNVLMQLEILVALAWLTGRALVLPPSTPLYLLGDGPHPLGEFIDVNALRRHIPVLDAEAFAEAIGVPAFVDHEAFSDWMSAHGHAPGWNALDDVLVHPRDALAQRAELAERVLDRRPIHLDAAVSHAEVLYFPMAPETRMFGVAETFFLFGDARLERRVRRLVRDAIRYRPGILALAERALRAPALGGRFAALHIRRGDFHRQYEATQIGAERIREHTQALFDPGQTLYVATDETDPSFLDPFRDRFHIVTFRDLGVAADTKPHWTGMVETLVCAAAPGPFVGTRLSTFSSRIATLRGYLAMTPAGRAAGIDTALYYTQPPLDAVGDESRPYDPPAEKHEDARGETRQPWWQSAARVPLWARAYSEVWRETEDSPGVDHA